MSPLFVSNDQKPDWMRKGQDGQIYGPRRELIDEMLTKGGCTDFWIYPLDRYLEIAGRVFQLDTKDAVTEAERIKVAQGQDDARWRSRQTSIGRLALRPRPLNLEDDPETLEVWEAWKDTMGQPNLALTLKQRNYLRSLMSQHGADLLCHGIRAWTNGWFEYDNEDFVTEESATCVWNSLDEIIRTRGSGYAPPPAGSPPDDNSLGIDDIPF